MTNKTNAQKMHGQEYVNLFESNQSAQRLARLIEHINLSNQDSILDCGCGNGMLLPLVENSIQSYTGIDFSPEFIEKAKENHKKSKCDAHFSCESLITHCNQNREAYDIAFAMDLSEHIEDSEWKEILSAIRHSLKKNGRLYIHTPNRNFFIERMKEHNFILKQFPEHIAVRTPEENRELIIRSGYSNITTEKLPHYNFLRLLHPLSYIPIVGKWFEARMLITAEK
ncbi:MAG: class I SAM-dependent methyltransferase [Cellvibrionaceae bacterium]